MATLQAADAQSAVSSRTVEAQRMEVEMTFGLPPDHRVVRFTSLSALQNVAQDVFSKLRANNERGNQYIVVKDIPKAIRSVLGNDPRALGVEFRLQFARSSVVIKIVPSHAHDTTTRNMSEAITSNLRGQGIPRARNYQWSGSATFRDATGQKGKEADECFLPRSRMGLDGQPPRWPTLVIETAVSESHAKLLRDATWWFETSNGEVRMVLLLTIKRARRTVQWELLQLAPPGQPAPGNPLCMNPPTRPMMATQHPAQQRQYVAQQGMINTANGEVTGTLPMTIYFHELFDGAPTGTQGDLTFTAQDLLDIADCI